jgi:hypothetical protein
VPPSKHETLSSNSSAAKKQTNKQTNRKTMVQADLGKKQGPISKIIRAKRA